jgi:hypothetical protein
MTPTHEELMALWNLCSGFVEEHKVSCPETVYQVDSVSLACQEFVADVCKQVGFYGSEEEKE